MARTINVGGNQGRGDPPATRPGEFDTSAIENPSSLLASPWLWILGVLCVLAWSGAWYAIVNWLWKH